MSRLDSFINRMSAQRDLHNHVRDNLQLPAEGPVLEVGLGNGRTYSHLRENFSNRRVLLLIASLPPTHQRRQNRQISSKVKFAKPAKPSCRVRQRSFTPTFGTGLR